MKTILMMAEICGYCFWEPGKSPAYIPAKEGIETEDLPLSWETNNQLTEWLEFYDYNICGVPHAELNIHNFDIVGKTLWQIVQEELGAEYKVVYYSEVEQKVIEECS